jgi:hypothetical protein
MIGIIIGFLVVILLIVGFGWLTWRLWHLMTFDTRKKGRASLLLD